MKNPASTLILTKLYPPAVRSNAILRERLLQKMTLQPETDLILVCAPAGYGKTTLLVEWTRQVRRDGVEVIWYGLDESDNHPAAFGAYLLTGLVQILGPGDGLGQNLQALRSATEMDWEMLLPTMINAILGSGKEIVVILDDYHLVHEKKIHRAVEFLLAYRPVNLHLVISSRKRPVFDLPRMRARGRVIEIKTGDLRFSGEETAQFLAETLDTPSPGGIPAGWLTQLEGWPAGLQLAAISLGQSNQGDAPSTLNLGGHRRLAEYWLEEVVNRLPEETQSFLLYTSILERMSAAVCDQILGVHGSDGRIRDLENANLFVVSLDSTGIWYRYHHLFRDFLRDWLYRTQPEAASRLHKNACACFAGQGLVREAAYHAFQSKDWAFAADFVEQNCFTLIVQSEIATIYEWTSAFPESILAARPMLCIFQALALSYHFERRNQKRIEARLSQAEQSAGGRLSDEAKPLAAVVYTFLGMVPDPQADANTHLARAQDYLNDLPEGDPERFSWLLIAGYSLLALRRISEADKFLREALPLAQGNGLFFGVIETTFHLAGLAINRGRLDEALALCQQARESLAALDAMDLPALGCLDVMTGQVLLEQNHLEEARTCLDRGMERMGWGMNPYYLMTGFMAQARLYLRTGRPDKALGCLDSLERVWPDIQFLTRELRILIRLRDFGEERTLQAARFWLENHPVDRFPAPGLGPIGAAEVYYQANLEWLRMQIAVGDPQIALASLEKPLSLAGTDGLRRRELQLTLLKAQALWQLGREQPAMEALEQALVISEETGLADAFDQGPLLDELIHRAARTGVGAGNAQKILAGIRASRREDGALLQPANQDAQLCETLSLREQEILRLMAEGTSNQDIAERLVIGVGTVKTHINHILGKLGVKNRTEAVARGRKAGIL